MAFTVRTVTHQFKNADGTAAVGAVVFELSLRMTNDGQTVLPGIVTGTLDGAGNLSVQLTANDDTDTVPVGSQWSALFQISDCENDTYYITVPFAGSGPIDLGSLLPNAPQVN